MGASIVWLITFTTLWLFDEHEHWAGVIGLLFILGMGVWLSGLGGA